MTTPAETITALARRYRLDVNLGTALAPNWTFLPAIREFQPVYEPVIVDDRTYDDEGAPRNVKTAYNWNVTLKISHRNHPETGAWNAAQENLRMAAEGFNDASYAHVRWYDRDGKPEAYEGLALVTWTPDGGDGTATDVVTVLLTGHGVRQPIDNPIVEEEE
ncbi:phage tail tube protein [Herbidospora mongoliensis]|uniref:phage tail tube protein n=1 Tax=Herbidospora mongoliensis TaxID=688067 RepID=UPI000832D8AF|nr:hypothetical protein [Herbidospora mongoliensis]